MFFNAFRRLTAEQAKTKVFEHWSHLDALAKRRFPNQENLAQQATLDVLEQLERDDWKRIRAWEGKGSFLTFLMTISSRLLTDYARKQFGYSRPPKWLQEKDDPIWHKAYRLLQVQHYERQEAIELLRSDAIDRPLVELDQVVAEVLARCQRAVASEQTVNLEQCAELVASQPSPMQALLLNSQELIEVLIQYLNGHSHTTLPDCIQAATDRLQQHLQLDDTDRMLLYLYYVEGLSLKTIVARLHLSGDPYKRLKRLLKQLQQACVASGLDIKLDDSDESNRRPT